MRQQHILQRLLLAATLAFVAWLRGSGRNPADHHLRTSPASSSSHHPRWLQGEDEACFNVTEACCRPFFPECEESEANPFSSVPFAIQIILIIVLIFMSALFSGLTLGLMSLDITGLEIVMSGDDPQQAAYAKKIYPVRQRGNLLLCTLLLGNVAVNALLSILLADKAGGIVGFLASTFLIVIFGEIIPQALCSRYPLEIGSRTVMLVRVIMLLVLPISFPLAWMLDKALGQELATTYSNAEMMKLLQIHVQENVLDPDTAVAMTGALQYRDRLVRDVMTKASNLFMLSVDDRLDFRTIAQIFKTGYSRIPVYEVSRDNVIGLLFVKDLIFIDPEDGTRVADFVQIFGRGMHVVWPDDRLGDVLRELKQGKSHMALVRDVHNQDEKDPYYEVIGIITLEDIIEEIIGEEIVDETDAYIDGTHAVPVDRSDAFKWARLRLLDSQIVDEKLSFDECRAVTAHLRTNYASVVAELTDVQLHRMIAHTPVALIPAAEHKVGEVLPETLLYRQGELADACTLVLSGKITVLVGADQFRSDVSSWSLLGAGALSADEYRPDFSAFVSVGPCRCLRLTRAALVVASNDESPLENDVGGADGDGLEEDHSASVRDDTQGSTTSSFLIPVRSRSELKEEAERLESSESESESAQPPARKFKLLSALSMARGDVTRAQKASEVSAISSLPESTVVQVRDRVPEVGGPVQSDDEDANQSSRPIAYIDSSRREEE